VVVVVVVEEEEEEEGRGPPAAPLRRRFGTSLLVTGVACARTVVINGYLRARAAKKLYVPATPVDSFWIF
jgi:hypothetical protein